MSVQDLMLKDPRALRALAHPVRLAILERLQVEGPATATVCGAAVGVSPSAASYHLRTLARWGLVEEAPGGRGRNRPWRATATGFRFETPAGDADAVEAATSLTEELVAVGERWTREHLRATADLPPAWREASHVANTTLLVTPAEAAGLVRAVEELVRPYLRAGRDDAPEEARNARLLVRLFPRERP